ncbi:bifunctional 3-(3-hydroxy-phenyl)propionate/3-hydroxycinnamic acid hydroxylase [Streptomyces sp. NPDC050743]|uniref:bifunctional 3-(3-hydroxy-phenyl)propionate/3-hydroxycinnamic acid hydroxylase n=1 Tax=Streptomyces sp. NPDC050743 TaxID=3365634 RepID=UPI0037A5C517
MTSGITSAQPVLDHGTQTQPSPDAYDVVVVGYGPVGRMLALKLGRRGHRVLVVERQKTTYSLPRAVHVDDETARILQSVGVGPADLPHLYEPYDDDYEWRAADGTTILRLSWSGAGPSGWNVANFIHQPSLEAAIHEKVAGLDSVTIMRDWEAVSHQQQDDGVVVELRNAEGTRAVVEGRYVIGADGANSVVRSWIGGGVTDLGYFHDWLVVDLIPHGTTAAEPQAWQHCDPARPTTLVPGGPGRRRFEFMRLPHETLEELNDEATAWRLLKRWDITPQNATLERHTVYTFQAQWCDEWRRGRLLLAGDAAHLMPPFMGQGMCAGLRDVVNLEWKLHLVLAGKAGEELLDTYGPERAMHVRQFVEASMFLGEVICVTDPDEAEQRDRRMRAALETGIEPDRPMPRLGPGLYRDQEAAGLLSIQAMVRGHSGTGLLDDVTGGGGVLLLGDPRDAESLSQSRRDALAAVGIHVLELADEPGPGGIVDLNGDYRAWLGDAGATTVLIRPDFYAYGAAAGAADVDALVDGFLGDLRGGVKD